MAHRYCKWYVWTGACGALSRREAVWLRKKKDLLQNAWVGHYLESGVITAPPTPSSRQ